MIGGYGQGSWTLGGRVDEVSLYDRVLSIEEIQAIYAAGSAGKCDVPRIRVQPRSQVGYWGKSVAFNVDAVGSEPLSYQRRKDELPIGGATNDSLTITNLQMTDAGSYSVVVTNFLGSVPSNPAILTMNPAGVSLALYPVVTIDGVVGLTYGIQYSTDLSDTNSWRGAVNITLHTDPALA